MITDNLKILGLNLKLINSKQQKNILISIGDTSDKEKVKTTLIKLSKLDNINIYATKGTYEYCKHNNIPTFRVIKLSESIHILNTETPTISSLLSTLDLVVNIPVKNTIHFDISKDNNIIRNKCIENNIPLITDIGVFISTIEFFLNNKKRTLKQDLTSWDLTTEFHKLIAKYGGYHCYHAHLDKAYLINMENLQLGHVDMQKKWELYQYLKENYTHDDLIQRMSRGVESMIEQGVVYLRTFIDSDSTVELKCIQAAVEIKKKYADQIKIDLAIQPLQGIVNQQSREYFIEACKMADIIGGLPSRDRPNDETHIDFILNLSKELGKPADFHLDQENNNMEYETELLANKIIEHGLEEGNISGVHIISVSAKEELEQNRILDLVKKSGMKIIICPSAALSMKPLKQLTPTHNSIAPLTKLLERDIPIGIGVDNIHDLFMPCCTGDIWFECKMLMEACRYYDIDIVARMASGVKY